jgi:large subunit ribosomal protein L9
MEIVLLERVEHLGQLGDVVNVKPGYARNYLLPQKKALRATKSNLVYFERRKADLLASNDKRRAEAEASGKKIDGTTLTVIRQASEAGQLYGSVAPRDIADALAETGASIERRQVVLGDPIKMLGIFPVRVVLHPEVSITVTVNVARSAEEAKIQLERGKAVTGADRDREEEEAEPQEAFEADAASAEQPSTEE